MKIKDKWKIHIMCGGLTLLFVLSTYIFYDETAGIMPNLGIQLEYTEVAKTEIDDTYSLVKEIDLSEEVDLQEELFYIIEGDDGFSSEAIIYFEDVSELISISVDSNVYLDKSGEFNSSEGLTISFEYDKWINKDFGVKFNVKQNLNYEVMIHYWKPEDTTEQPSELNGIIKIYERIGGEINE